MNIDSVLSTISYKQINHAVFNQQKNILMSFDPNNMTFIKLYRNLIV